MSGFGIKGRVMSEETRYGWRLKTTEGFSETREFATKAERDEYRLGTLPHLWKKYKTTRKVKGRPLWWALKQLAAGRKVIDVEAKVWIPSDLQVLLRSYLQDWDVVGPPDWASDWALYEDKKSKKLGAQEAEARLVADPKLYK